jgi:hypothetical protein
MEVHLRPARQFAKTVREELTFTRRKTPEGRYCTVENGWHTTREYRYQKDIEYHKNYTLSRMQYLETRINRNKRKENRK